ncbi:MAG TPA: type II toxin-antitoxin system prevent-host-death family antitoxin [Thiobacillaceae bacterium]|nr:type II toxin-antitoxin system prevent-host-death family antitoxin [Thiobacillaceae bacterium]
MEAITYTEARNNLARTMDKVNDDHAPVIITRQNGQPVVMMSLEDFEAWQETDYLLRSPANASWLLESVEQDRKGRAKPHKLADPE